MFVCCQNNDGLLTISKYLNFEINCLLDRKWKLAGFRLEFFRGTGNNVFFTKSWLWWSDDYYFLDRIWLALARKKTSIHLKFRWFWFVRSQFLRLCAKMFIFLFILMPFKHKMLDWTLFNLTENSPNYVLSSNATQ